MLIDPSRENDLLCVFPRFGDAELDPAGPSPQPGAYPVVRAVLEFCLAGLLLVLVAPLLLVCAVLIKLTSRGPVLYRQLRVGRGGHPYWIYKLRTMHHLCEAKSGPQWSQAGDPRVTPLGRFLRNTHLDELPQLWNILRGEMSLVGPRPERPEFVPALAQAIPCYTMRLAVRPGVTGLAQVQWPADTDVNGVRIKVAYDLYYIRHLHPWMDVCILVATVLKVFGVSFNLLGKGFRFPTRTVVERSYQHLQKSTPAPSAPALPVPVEPTPVPLDAEFVPAP
jgi:lipopolysaccharide/colanic/teichoic acid biosynthesis glycosyltransferase